jgi:hypothetical protein
VPDSAPQAKRPRPTVEDEEDEEAGGRGRFPMEYPGNVAEILGTGETEFQKLYKQQQASEQNPWAPFEDKDEWELAEWLMKRANKTSIDEFLKLPIVCLVYVFHYKYGTDNANQFVGKRPNETVICECPYVSQEGGCVADRPSLGLSDDRDYGRFN